MGRIVDWNIDDVIDAHQTHKSRRIKAIARVLKRKGRVNYKRFLAEMQFLIHVGRDCPNGTI